MKVLRWKRWDQIYHDAITAIANWPGYYEEKMVPDIQEFAARMVSSEDEEEAESILRQHLEEVKRNKIQ